MNELFGTSLRRDPSAPPDLMARIDLQVRERLEEAIDLVGLDTIVQARRARGLRPPDRDNDRDFREYSAAVRAFLDRLRTELVTDLPESVVDRVEAAARRAGDDELARVLAGQVVLAKELPDYWQRFEQVRVAYTTERAGSGGEGAGFLGRLFGRT